ncbi:MAG: relaxase domain-containing protein, partial [Actinomycetota bacterium]|nr:relaxase domain-containing protein [Actinomycetota bacterium]
KGPDAGLYYVEALGGYYLDAGEPLGVWQGSGAERLGLEGEVDDEVFLALIAGLHPQSGDPLGRRYGARSVRGFDATASAPKSVSVLFALGDEATRQEVLAAHDAAVSAMVGWIEDHALTRYRLDGEVVTVDSEGIVAARFRQHTSRALDPQLHTHVVIPNRVFSGDGRWLSLDARTLKMDQRTLSALYHAGLRAELTRRLGVAWEEPVNRIAEISSVPSEVRAEFSSRTEAVNRRIEEKLERFEEHFERGPTPRERWRLEREAVAESRPSKAHGLDAESLHTEWAERAGGIGYRPEHVVAHAVCRPAPERPIDPATEMLIVDQALAVLAETQSTWRPAELVRELAAAVPTDVSIPAPDLAPWIDRLADRVIAERLVELSRPLPEGVPLRRDGRPITESALDRVLTTPGILAQEERLIVWAEKRLGANGHPVAPRRVPDALSGPQREVAAAIAGTEELVLVVGPAGTGKTTAIGPAIEQLREDGRPVFGVAPSATAAEVLALETGVEADTLDKLLIEHSLRRPPDHRYDLPPGSTVVVDEVSMVPTPKLAALATLADDRGWRTVFVGDPLQFSAVGRSGMFGHLVKCYGAIELDTVHRFRSRWEREASLRLREGDVDALDLYDAHGRVHGGSRRKMEQEVLQAWWDAREGGEATAMMALTNETVVKLNQRAQCLRGEAGELRLDRRSVAAGEYRLYVGDVVATRHNDRDLRTDRGFMVKNRDQWEVAALHRDGALTVSGRTGTVRLPAEYVASHVELAYAQTGHAAQGRTVERAFLLLDSPCDGPGLYVPMTRGRRTNEVFVVLEGEETAVDVLAQALTRDWIDRPAVARRAELAERAGPRGPTFGQGPLPAFEVRRLLERHHEITRDLCKAEVWLESGGEQFERMNRQRAELADQLADAEARQKRALEVIEAYDHPLRRRLHRPELERATIVINQTGYTVRHNNEQIRQIDDRMPWLEDTLAKAEATIQNRPDLEREQRYIGRLLDRDLDARRLELGSEPAGYLTGFLGPRPSKATEVELWDGAAARIEQHRAAFDLDDSHDLLGPRCRRWDDSALAMNQRTVLEACDALDRGLGRALEIEPPGLDLGL